jgi:hypothetical protein
VRRGVISMLGKDKTLEEKIVVAFVEIILKKNKLRYRP